MHLTVIQTRLYSQKVYFEDLMTTFEPLDLIQLVNFKTWRRIVNGNWRSSVIDHIYTNHITTVEEIVPHETIIGDHVLITMLLCGERKANPIITERRDWSKYSWEALIQELQKEDLAFSI